MNKRNNILSKLKKEDGPFEYNYIAIASIPGIKFDSNSDEPIKLYEFSDLGAEVFLTPDCNALQRHLDRSDALAYLWLTSFRGLRKFGRISVYWHKILLKIFGFDKIFRQRFQHEVNRAKKERLNKEKKSRCYLVYKASGPIIEPFDLSKARKVNNIGIGFDIISGKKYREIHKSAMYSSAVALAIAKLDSNNSSEIHFGRDIIYLKGTDDLYIYPRSINMGSPKLTVVSPIDKVKLKKVEHYIPHLTEDRKLVSAIYLHIQSQKVGIDHLRSFIAGWSALELLVNRLSKKLRNEWEQLVDEGNLPEWDKDFKTLEFKDYRLRDRFFSLACVLDFNNAKSDVQSFIEINNKRSGFYHRLTVEEKDLPIYEIQTLFQKFLKLSTQL